MTSGPAPHLFRTLHARATRGPWLVVTALGLAACAGLAADPAHPSAIAGASPFSAASISAGAGTSAASPSAVPETEGVNDPAATAFAPDEPPVTTRRAPGASLFATLPRGAEQRHNLCARGYSDRIARAFCADPAPSIRGLADVLALFDLHYDARIIGLDGNGTQGNAAFVLAGHSPGLTTRMVSPLNPRLIVFTPPVHTGASSYHYPPDLHRTAGFVAIAYTRGEQFVELVTRDPTGGDLRFFLLAYEQACSRAPGGCDNLDLFGPGTETDWRATDLYDERDLANTPADCNVCHQPEGHGKERVLLMQTRVTPWNHFFRYDRDGGRKLYGMYRLAHAESEPYGALPGKILAASNPAMLAGLVENEGYLDQPIPIPATNGWPWLYERFRAGKLPALAYFDADTADELAVLRVAKAYAAVLAGRAPRADMPWLGDLDRPTVRVHDGTLPPPGASGREILVASCRRCHNPTLDPNLSRARFDVDALDTMPALELERALERIALPPDSPLLMPPARLTVLDEQARTRVAEALRAVLARR